MAVAVAGPLIAEERVRVDGRTGEKEKTQKTSSDRRPPQLSKQASKQQSCQRASRAIGVEFFAMSKLSISLNIFNHRTSLAIGCFNVVSFAFITTYQMLINGVRGYSALNNFAPAPTDQASKTAWIALESKKTESKTESKATKRSSSSSLELIASWLRRAGILKERKTRRGNQSWHQIIAA